MVALFGFFLATLLLGYADGNALPTYYASIIKKVKSSYSHRCGATLISEDVIVTTASCFTAVNDKVNNNTKQVKPRCRAIDFLSSKAFMVLLDVTSDEPAHNEIDYYKVHPEVGKNCDKNDVAVARFQRRKLKTRPIPIIIDPLALFCDCAIYAVQQKDKNQTELLTSNMDGRIINIFVSRHCRGWYLCGFMYIRRGPSQNDSGVDDDYFPCILNNGSPLVCDKKLIGILLPKQDKKCFRFLKVPDHVSWIKKASEESSVSTKLSPAIFSAYFFGSNIFIIVPVSYYLKL